MKQMQSKRIRVIQVHPPREYLVEVTPGRTFEEIMKELGLDSSDWVGYKPIDYSEFQPDEEVFPNVEEGSKLPLENAWSV